MSPEPNAGNPQGANEPTGSPAGQGQNKGEAPGRALVPRAGAHQGPASLPPVLSTTPNALALLKALRRRWLLGASAGLLLAAALGPAAWFLVPPPKHTVR